MNDEPRLERIYERPPVEPLDPDVWIWDEVDDLLNRYDSDLKLCCASRCAWGGTLRVTLTDPRGAPSRSITFHSVGGGEPEDVARRLIDDFHAWHAETGTDPMDVPEWMDGPESEEDR